MITVSIILLILYNCTICWSFWDVSMNVTNEPAGSIAGELFPKQPVISIYDKRGYVRLDFTGYASARLHQSPNRLGSFINNTCFENEGSDSVTGVPFIRGIAKFSNLCINKADREHRIHFFIVDEYGLILAQTLGSSLRVDIGPAFKLGVLKHPSGAYGGIPWSQQPMVSVQDKGGNTIVNEIRGSVRVELYSDNLVAEELLCSDVCSGFNVTLKGNTARFKGLYVRKAAMYKLKFFSDISVPGDRSAFSLEFLVQTGVAAKLLLKREPSEAKVFGGKAFIKQPILHVVDAGGNLVVSDSSSAISVSIYSNPSGGILSPTVNLITPVQAGIARFTRLMIDKAGKGYQLVYSQFTTDNGTKETGISILGTNFTVNVGDACRLEVLSAPTKVWANNNPFVVQPKLALTDAGGNVILDDSSTIVSALVVPSLAHSTRLVIDTSSGKSPDIVQVTFDDRIQNSSRIVFSPGDRIGIVVKLDHEIIVTTNHSSRNLSQKLEKPFFPFHTENIGDAVDQARAVLSDAFLNRTTRDLLFIYDVVHGYDQVPLLYNGNFSIDSGDYLINDLFGRSVTLTLPGKDDKRNQLVRIPLKLVDSNPAFVQTLELVPSNGIYGAGQELLFHVHFNRMLIVFGEPEIQLNVRSRIALIETLALGSSLSKSYFFLRIHNRISKGIPWNASPLMLEVAIGEITNSLGNICISRSMSPQSDGYRWAIRFDSLLSLDSLEVEVARIMDQDRSMILNVSFLDLYRPIELWLSDSGDEFMCTRRFATFQTGSGTSSLTFSYLVLPGDFSARLDVTPSSVIMYRSIDDCVCNFINQDNVCSVPVNSSLHNISVASDSHTFVDTAVPYIVDVLLAGSYQPGTVYTGGDSIQFNVQFSQPVVVESGLILPLNTGRLSNIATYIAGSGTDVITLEYTVKRGHHCAELDFDDDLHSLILPSPSAFVRRLSNTPSTDASLLLPTHLKSLLAFGISVNGVPPKIKDVFLVFSTQNPYFRRNDRMIFVVEFSYKVTILTSSLALILQVGDHEREAAFIDGNNTDRLSFEYVVVTGDRAFAHTLSCIDFKVSDGSNIIPIYQYSSNPIVLAEYALTDMCNFHLIGLVIDTDDSPLTELVEVAMFQPFGGRYSIGEEVRVRTVFTDSVFCSPSYPQLYLNTGSMMQYESGCGSSVIIFRHVTGENDSTESLDWMNSPLTNSPILCVAPCQLTNANGDAVHTIISGPITNLTGISIDAEIPEPLFAYTSIEESDVSCPLTAGDEVFIHVKFSLPVKVHGHEIYLPVEATRRILARYHVDKSNDTDIVFLYKIEFGHISLSDITEYVDGIYIPPHTGGALSYIRRKATYPIVEAKLNLLERRELFLDSPHCNVIEAVVIPRVAKVYCRCPDGIYSPGDEITIVVAWSHSVYVDGLPRLVLDTGSTAPAMASYSSGSGTNKLSFVYTIQAGQNSEALDVIDTESLVLTDGDIYRWSKNPTIPVDMEIPISDDFRSLSSNSRIVINSRAPHITKIWSPMSSGFLSVDDVVIIIIEFSRPVIVSGDPYLVLSTGRGRQKQAFFSHQPTESSTAFEYKVQLGDMSRRLDYWTMEEPKTSASLNLNGGSIKLRSSRPIVDADIHLNPVVGYLGGRVEKIVENGLVSFDDLTIASRGLEYKIWFAALVRNRTIENSSQVSVEPSGEYELMPNLIDRHGQDMFGYSTGVAGDVLVVGAPRTFIPPPQIQVILLTTEAVDGENEIQMIETRLLSTVPPVLIQTFYTAVSNGETLGGSLLITYYDGTNYAVGSPLIVPAHVDSTFLAASLEGHYPFLGSISVTRSENLSCNCKNGWRWDITFHDASSQIGVLKASGDYLTGDGSHVSDTSIIRSDHFISGSFLVTRPEDSLQSRPIAFNATTGELSFILEQDLGLSVISISAVNIIHDDPSFGRRWLITFSSSGNAPYFPVLRTDGAQLSGTGVSIVLRTVSEGKPPIGGSFALSILGSKFSYYVPYNASNLLVQQALESLESVRHVTVSQSIEAKWTWSWTVTFLSVNRLTDYGWIADDTFDGKLPLLTVDSQKLMGSTIGVNYFTEKSNEGIESGRVTVFRKLSDIWEIETLISPSDSGAYDHFGHSVDVAGDLLIVGSPFSGDRWKCGSAYIFGLRNDCDYCIRLWTEIQKLNPIDNLDHHTDSSEFGYSVLLRNDSCNRKIAVIGSPGFQTDSGKVYIFRQLQEEWIYDSFVTPQKFINTSIGDRFGQVIDFFNDILVVAAPGHNEKRGAVYIFQQDKDCISFLSSQVVYGPDSDPGDMFGAAVSFMGHDMVACAPYQTIYMNGQRLAKAGLCYVYRRVGSNAFYLLQVLMATNLKSNDRFGYSSAMSSNKMLIGQVEEYAGLLTQQCPVQVVRLYSGSTAGYDKLGAFFRLGWRQRSSRPLSSSITATLLRAAIEEDLATGTVSVERTGPDIRGGFMWLVTFKALDIIETTFPKLACDVTEISGPHPICSVTITQDLTKKIRRKVHVFTLESERWIEQALLFPKFPQRQDMFGTSVSLAGNMALVGAPNRELTNINSGAAVIYDLSFADIRFVTSTQSINEGERITAHLRRENAEKSLVIGIRTIDRNSNAQHQSYVNQIYDFRSGEIFPTELTTIDLLEKTTAFGRNQYYGSEETRSEWVDGMFDYRGLSDYSSIDMLLYFDSGEKVKKIIVETLNDKIFEAPDETFSIHVSLPGMYASSQGKLHMNVTIVDDGDGVVSDDMYYRKVCGSRTVPGDQMGSTIAIDAETGIMLVGNSPPHSSDDDGFVYVYKKLGMAWKEDTVLMPSKSANRSSFGRSLCIQRTNRDLGRLTVMIGAPDQGKAYIYVQRNSSSPWIEETVLDSLDESHKLSSQYRFAEKGATALEGDLAIVGAAGLEKVFVYRRYSYNYTTDLYTWGIWMILHNSRLSFDNKEQLFGTSIAAKRRVILVGAPISGSGKIHAYYSRPQVLRIAFSFSSKPMSGSWRLVNSARYERNEIMSDKDSSLTLLPFNITADGLESYMKIHLNVGDVTVKVSELSGTAYEIMWDITLWDIYDDSYVTMIPLWKGYGCDECDKFDSSEQKNLSFKFYTEILQNASEFELEDILQPSDGTIGDWFGNAVAINGNYAIVGAMNSPAKTRTSWNFETGDLTGWSKTGRAFAAQPIAVSDQFYKSYKGIQESHHRQRSFAKGKFYIDTFYNYNSVDKVFTMQGNDGIGTLTSDPFIVRGDKIAFMIGGGCDHLAIYVELLIDGYSTLRATGTCEEVMMKVSWDVSEYKDRSGQIKIVDHCTSSWGHIKVDEFVFDWDIESPFCLSNNAGQCAFGGGEILRSNSTFQNAYLGPEETSESGAAYIFYRVCATNRSCSWIEDARLVASDKRAGDHFGFSVTIDDRGSVAAVGSPNSASFGMFREIPSVYPHINTSLVDFPINPKMEYMMKSGYTHSPLHGHLRVINHYMSLNHPNDSPALFNQQSGAVYIYHRQDIERDDQSCWQTTEDAKVSPPDVFASDHFGYSIGLGASLLAVGATGNDHCCGESGGALYFISMKWQRVRFERSEYVVLEGTDDIVTVKIVRDKEFTNQTLTVGYSTSDLSAIGVDETKFRRCSLSPLNKREGCGDYMQASGDVTFKAGDEFSTFQVRIVNDLCWERHSEFIHIQLHVPGGVPIYGAGFRAHIRIDDDDWPLKRSTKINCVNAIG